MANLEVFSFLDECEARAKLCDHGPYRINDEEVLVFREISHLYDGNQPHFLWSETSGTVDGNLKEPLRLVVFLTSSRRLGIHRDVWDPR